MNKKMIAMRAAASEFAYDAASCAGILAQRECLAAEKDRHEAHGRFAAHDAAAKKIRPVAFAAELAYLMSQSL